MKIQRTLPPAAAPVPATALVRAAVGMVAGSRYLRRIETELKRHFGVRHVFLTSSGKSALTLILKALHRVTGRREVVIPAYTCFSVPAAIARAGLDVRVCDIDPTTLDFDHKRLTAMITERTMCVVPTHLFGLPSDVARVVRMCQDRGVAVVEDAAQAMGAREQGRLLGTLGDVGFFSFDRGKAITCGSGGVVVTNSDRIGRVLADEYTRTPRASVARSVADLLRLVALRVFVTPRLFWIPKAMPWLGVGRTTYDVDFPVTRLSGVNAGALLGWRERLSSATRMRAATAAYFGAALGSLPRPPAEAAPARLAVLMESREARDRMYALSEARGLGLGLMYPTPITAIEALRPQLDGQRVPGAMLVAERLLTIPTHHLVSDTDRRAMCDLLQRQPAREMAA
jgi:perosamine synthetase